MTKLKHYKMVDAKYCTDCVCVIPSEVYLKPEVDEAIAELKAQLESEKASRYAELRHQKYKRCLAMAELWSERFENSNDHDNTEVSFKRRVKWLELAERFKGAK